MMNFDNLLVILKQGDMFFFMTAIDEMLIFTSMS